MADAVDVVNILLVDDDPANLLALEAILQPLGHRLIKANSGSQALRALLDKDFAVILMDVRMPDMSGFEAASLIRQRPRSRNIPIIFLTGSEKSNDAMFEGYSTGAVDYLMKPASATVLRSKVEVFVELAVARLRLEHQVREREQAARELQRLNALLEHGNDELAQANRELDAFCAAVSHDLRTPLSQIMGFAQLLDLTARPRLNEQDLQYLRHILQVGDAMNRMVTDFLTFARLGTSPLHTEVVDMRQLVDEVVSHLTAQGPGEAHAVEWDIAALPPVPGDRSMLRYVWINLLSNALKYGRVAKPTRIRVRGEDQGREIAYSVSDNGAGFDPAQAHKLFGAFSRLHQQSEFEGIGIGLSSVKRVVLKHGGRVWAESQPGQGATFYFALLKEPTAAQAPDGVR